MVRAAGHHPCSAPLSGMPLGIVVVVVGVQSSSSSSSSSHHALSLLHCTRCRRRAMPSRCAPCCHRTPSSSLPRVVVIVVAAPLSSRHTPCHCAPLLHCHAIVTPLDPPSSPWCHWAPSSHRLRIAGPAAVAVRRCRALYPPCCTPLPSHCVCLHRCAVVRCCHHRAWCACLARWASVLWRGAWAVGLSMGWWRGRRWGPFRVACVAVIVAVRHCRCCWFVMARPHEAGTALFCATLGLFLADGGGVVCPRRPRWRSWWWWHGVVAVGWSRRACGWQSMSRACVQCQGLWARWTVVWGGAIGAVRSSSPQQRRVVVAVSGSQCACGW